MRRVQLRRWMTPLCGLLLAAGCASQAAAPSTPAPTPAGDTVSAAPTGGSTALPTSDCAPVNGAQFLCGVVNIEQLTRVEGTRWAVGSSAAGGAVPLAPLYFLDLDAKQATPLDPTTVSLAEDKAAYPGCPGPPDFGNLQSLGVTAATIDGRNSLVVVSHGGGFTIQVFDMDLSGALPALTWRGCVLPPDEHFWPDATAVLPDGGMLITSLFDPKDAEFVAALKSGAPYGKLGEWHADSGWKEVYPGTLSGPNGVILSQDGNTIYVANWSGRRVSRIDRRTGETTTADLPMLVDNLAWNEDGTAILAGGQADTIDNGFACSGGDAVNCSLPFAVYQLDPTTLATKPILERTVLGVMGAGTGALQHGDTLWLTSYRSDRLARIAYPT